MTDPRNIAKLLGETASLPPIERLAAVKAGVDAALTAEVVAARKRGDSWATIGKALGISKQAAQQRFGGS